MEYSEILDRLQLDYLLVNSTNEYLVEYPDIEENARYTLTGFSGSTGDALLTKNNIYLFVDGRYHTQADLEAKDGVTVVKLALGQRQDDKIQKLLDPQKVLGIVSKKVSQKRLESFSNFNIRLLSEDPINNHTTRHTTPVQAVAPVKYSPDRAMFITNLEEVSYLTGLRDFSKDCSSKAYIKLFIKGDERKVLENNYEEFLSSINEPLFVDKESINAYDYALIKKPIAQTSPIKSLKSVKADKEIECYIKAFERTDNAVRAIREYIESNDNLSEFDILKKLKEEFLRYGAKSLSFNSIVAINQNSALAHYSKNSKEVILKEGALVLIDCGAYYEEGMATDITRVFVKGEPSDLQKTVYTTVLKAFLNAYNYPCTKNTTGYEIDKMAHTILDNKIEGFTFGHGLGHGIGINVHEAPPALNQSEIAHTEIEDNMCFTIEPGLYNPQHFGIRLENSCCMKGGKICSFVKMGYEGKLINFDLLSDREKEWLKEFEIL